MNKFVLPLIFLLFLTGAAAPSNPSVHDSCIAIAKTHEVFAVERDKGVTPSVLAETLWALSENGDIPKAKLPLLLTWVIHVYSNPESPSDIRSIVYTECMKANKTNRI